MMSLENETKTISQIDEVTLNELREKAKEKAQKAVHNWKQRGIWMVCTSCDNTHAVYVGVNKLLVNVENGIPVFKS